MCSPENDNRQMAIDN